MRNYSEIDNGSNYSTVTLGKLTVAFSYRTVIGFHNGRGWKVSENLWGPTTGKHINALGIDKKGRLLRAEFEVEYEKTLKEFGLID